MSTARVRSGRVTLVGADPGDPELLTLKALRAIRRATVLLLDDLVSDAVLRLARKAARIVRVGKRGGCSGTPQAFIERLMATEAFKGEQCGGTALGRHGRGRGARSDAGDLQGCGNRRHRAGGVLNALAGATHAAVVHHASLPQQRTIGCTPRTLASTVHRHRLRSPAIISSATCRTLPRGWNAIRPTSRHERLEHTAAPRAAFPTHANCWLPPRGTGPGRRDNPRSPATRMCIVKPPQHLLLLSLALICGSASADINVGVTVSATGPAASLGIPEKNTIALMPKTIAGQKLNYIVLDDASDTTAAVSNTRKLITESKVDIILGSTITPNSLAMIDVVAESKTPMISMAASARIVEPVDDKRRWVFKTPQNDIMMSLAIVTHMANAGVRTAGYIGFADAYGEGWSQEFAKIAAIKKIQIVANERYARTDTSVTGQVLKIVSAKPDAVLIGASGTPAALPQKALHERGYSGRYYQTHGVANGDFLRVGGKDVEGTFLPAGPVLVAEQLPPHHPVRKSALAYVAAYEAAYGKGSVSTFGAHAWDAGLLLADAVPRALKKAQPGTPEFRSALRDALEQVKEMAGAHGIFTMSPTDHLGLDQRARVMVKIQDGKWVLQPGL